MIQFSLTGIPYIQIDSDTRVIFSGLENDRYKRLTFSGHIIQMIRTKEDENGKTKITEVRHLKEKLGFTMDMDMSKLPTKAKKAFFFTTKSQKLWKEIIEKYLDENKTIHKNDINKFNKELENVKLEVK